MTQITLQRADQEKDREFARRVHHEAYRDVVTRQFDAWDDEQQDRFFERGWDASWESSDREGERFHTADLKRAFYLIVSGTTPIGITRFDITPTRLFLSELQILPHHQNKGVGTAVIELLIQKAKESGIPLRLQVLHANNGARRLYERLGFVVVLGEGVTHVQMEWRR
jgi:GNAT superfamily N-acetyltransferase